MDANFFQSLFYILMCFLFCYVAYMYTKILNLLKDDNSILKQPINIFMDNDDFECLVRGGNLKVAFMKGDKKHLVNIALKDIGFNMMYQGVEKAEKGENTYIGHNKIIE